jgi:hypothetical protein
MAIDKVSSAVIGELVLNIRVAVIMRSSEGFESSFQLWIDDEAKAVMALEMLGIPMPGYRDEHGEPGAILRTARVTIDDANRLIESTKRRLRGSMRKARKTETASE